MTTIDNVGLLSSKIYNRQQLQQQQQHQQQQRDYMNDFSQRRKKYLERYAYIEQQNKK
jgi:hypothetical protein